MRLGTKKKRGASEKYENIELRRNRQHCIMIQLKCNAPARRPPSLYPEFAKKKGVPVPRGQIEEILRRLQATATENSISEINAYFRGNLKTIQIRILGNVQGSHIEAQRYTFSVRAFHLISLIIRFRFDFHFFKKANETVRANAVCGMQSVCETARIGIRSDLG